MGTPRDLIKQEEHKAHSERREGTQLPNGTAYKRVNTHMTKPAYGWVTLDLSKLSLRTSFVIIVRFF